MVGSAPAMGETAAPCRCLAPQTWFVLDFVRTDLRTLRLAIGQEATTATGPCTPRKSREATIHLHQEEERAVLVEARSWRPISPCPEQRMSELGRSIIGSPSPLGKRARPG
jgi:hypothetical protein